MCIDQSSLSEIWYNSPYYIQLTSNLLSTNLNHGSIAKGYHLFAGDERSNDIALLLHIPHRVQRMFSFKLYVFTYLFVVCYLQYGGFVSCFLCRPFYLYYAAICIVLFTTVKANGE